MAVYAADLRVLHRAIGAVDDVTPQHLGQGAALRAECRVRGRSLDEVYLVEEARETHQIRERTPCRRARTGITASSGCHTTTTSLLPARRDLAAAAERRE